MKVYIPGVDAAAEASDNLLCVPRVLSRDVDGVYYGVPLGAPGVPGLLDVVNFLNLLGSTFLFLVVWSDWAVLEIFELRGCWDRRREGIGGLYCARQLER